MAWQIRLIGRLDWSIELFRSWVPFVLDSTTLKVIPVYSADLYVTMVSMLRTTYVAKRGKFVFPRRRISRWTNRVDENAELLSLGRYRALLKRRLRHRGKRGTAPYCSLSRVAALFYLYIYLSSWLRWNNASYNKKYNNAPYYNFLMTPLFLTVSISKIPTPGYFPLQILLMQIPILDHLRLK